MSEIIKKQALSKINQINKSNTRENSEVTTPNQLAKQLLLLAFCISSVVRPAIAEQTPKKTITTPQEIIQLSKKVSSLSKISKEKRQYGIAFKNGSYILPNSSASIFPKSIIIEDYHPKGISIGDRIKYTFDQYSLSYTSEQWIDTIVDDNNNYISNFGGRKDTLITGNISKTAIEEARRVFDEEIRGLFKQSLIQKSLR